MPLFGKGRPFTQSGCGVTTLVCSNTLVVISTPRHSSTFKKYGDRQADGDGQVSQAGSLAENVWDG